MAAFAAMLLWFLLLLLLMLLFVMVVVSFDDATVFVGGLALFLARRMNARICF